MRLFVTAAGAALLLAAQLPNTATPAAAAEDVSGANLASARTLAGLMNRPERVAREIDAMLVNMARHAFAIDPTLNELKAQYPGVEGVFIAAMRPIMMDEMAAALPDYNSQLATFYARNFTAVEIGELVSFWRSPAGRALLASVTGAVTYDATVKDVTAQILREDGDGNVQISGSTLDQDKRKAAIAGVGKLTPEQRVAVMRFSQSPTGQKLARLMPQKNAIDQQWANRDLSPEAVARIEREMPEALSRFIDAADARSAAKE